MAKIVVQTDRGPITRNFNVVQKLRPGKPDIREDVGDEVWVLADGTGSANRALTRVMPRGFTSRPILFGAIVGVASVTVLLATIRFLAI